MDKNLLEEDMIRVQLSDKQGRELEDFRRQASSKDSEKALMVLLNAEGKSPPEIAKLLKRHPHTVRDWIKRYIAYGIKGFNRKYSPGRPKEKRKRIMEYIETIISDLVFLSCCNLLTCCFFSMVLCTLNCVKGLFRFIDILVPLHLKEEY